MVNVSFYEFASKCRFSNLLGESKKRLEVCEDCKCFVTNASADRKFPKGSSNYEEIKRYILEATPKSFVHRGCNEPYPMVIFDLIWKLYYFVVHRINIF